LTKISSNKHDKTKENVQLYSFNIDLQAVYYWYIYIYIYSLY